MLQYRQGNYLEAERILSANHDNLTVEQDSERRIMLANVLMQRSEFTAARQVLSPVPMNTMLGAYATYNMGVAHLRANRGSEGTRLLESVMNLPVADTETNALKDRAALAIGYNYLQQKQPERARQALVNVRLEGPFSNPALLALGYAHYQRQDVKRSLSFWLELLARNPADPTVQEAMLLAPRAYEDLKANQQAIYGYKLAVNTYRDQLKALEKSQAALEQPQWLEELTPSANAGADADPLAIVNTVVVANNQETPFLYPLFATHQFNETFKQYQQLRRLEQLLDTRADELKALRDVASNLQKLNAPKVAGAESRIKDLDSRLAALEQRWQKAQSRGRDAGRQAENFVETASIADSNRLQKLHAMEKALDSLPATPANRELKDRFQRVYGLSLWGVATAAPVSQEELYLSLKDSGEQISEIKLRLNALRQLQADNKRVLAAKGEARIQQLSTRLASAQAGVQKALDEHRNYLRQLGRNTLNASQTRLNNDLAEAYLSIARLQDQAITQDAQQAALPERTN